MSNEGNCSKKGWSDSDIEDIVDEGKAEAKARVESYMGHLAENQMPLSNQTSITHEVSVGT